MDFSPKLSLLFMLLLFFLNVVQISLADRILAVYVNNGGEMIKIDDFLRTTNASSYADVKNPPFIYSCRNSKISKFRNSKQVEEENIQGLNIEAAAKSLAAHLRDISNYELGVTEVQTIFDSLPFKVLRVNYKEKVEMIAGRIKKKIGNYLESLDKTKRYVEELYIHHLWSQPITSTFPCSKVDAETVEFSQSFGACVNASKSCEMVATSEKRLGFSPGRNLTKLFVQNLKSYPLIKWQYFVTSEGVHSEYPAYSFVCDNRDGIGTTDNELRHNDIFTTTIYPVRKLVVILIDQSNWMTDKQFQLAKNMSIGIIESLSESDYVGLLTVDSVVHHPSLQGRRSCMDDIVQPVMDSLKPLLSSRIKSLQKTTLSLGANHSLGLQKSFEMISRSLQNLDIAVPSEGIQPLIMYVSRGLLWNLEKGKAVLKLISKENAGLNNSVIINTCAVVDNLRPVLNEKRFLKMVAEQRTGDDMSRSSKAVRVGKVVEFSNESNLRASVNLLWQSLKQTSNSDVVFTMPKWDSIGRDVVVGMAKPCFHMRNVVGLVGIDMHLDDFAEDVVFFNSLPSLKSYMFIVHKSGHVIAHSLFGRTKYLNSASSLVVDVADLQADVLNFQTLREKLLNDYVGQRKLKLKQSVGTNETYNAETKGYTHAMYTWRRIDDTPFVVCIVVHENNKSKQKMKTLSLKKSLCNEHVRYHRLDINPPSNLEKGSCRNTDRLVNLETSTLYLSPSSFASPFKYLNQVETKTKLNSYFGYLCDTTNLIPNPGMKSKVRSEVAAVIRIAQYWREQVAVSQLKNYVVRRYVGLPSGVIHTFPGMVIKKEYDVTWQHWYLEALEHTGNVVVSAPFSEGDGQLGSIVTLSHTIYEGKPASLHSSSDSVIAVMAMDLTFGYVHQLLMSTIPLCHKDSLQCFIFDSRGYFVAHPNLLKSGKLDQNFDHITHGEQLIANDILCHEGFVEKRACNDYRARTVQRSYHFNTNWKGILTNLVHGEHCARYQITVIPGTNLFLGVINQTCRVVGFAFCSCSTMDRLCLNCKKMEQTECECPCECPLSAKECANDIPRSPDIKMCRKASKGVMMARDNYTALKGLNSCVDLNCFSRKSVQDCFGVIGCVWCERNYDGSYLRQPFCTGRTKCYNGMLVNQAAFRSEAFTPNVRILLTTSVVAVGGGIMGFFVLLVLFIYCTRQLRQRNDPSLQADVSTYVLSPNDGNPKMLAFDNDPDECIDDHVQALNPHGMLLAEFHSVSPYRINSTYRRPAGGGTDSSDHGYSTMTPHDDSVHNGLTRSEHLAPVNKRNSNTTQSVTSFESEISSEPSAQLLTPVVGQTVLSDIIEPKHGTKFLAHAQVHMVEC